MVKHRTQNKLISDEDVVMKSFFNADEIYNKLSSTTDYHVHFKSKDSELQVFPKDFCVAS